MTGYKDKDKRRLIGRNIANDKRRIILNQAVYGYVETMFNKYVSKENIDKRPIDVLDIGSLDMNGTTKEIFKDCRYTGVDITNGKNVDLVVNAHKMPFYNNQFDCVVCVEMLEHDTDPAQTFEEIYRVLKVGGVAIISARSIGCPLHCEPRDYFRITKYGLEMLLRRISGEYQVIEHGKGVFGWCIKHE